MTIVTLGNGEISVRGHETATDGVYVPVKQFAENVGVEEPMVWMWRARGSIETITLFREVFVRKNCPVLLRRVEDPQWKPGKHASKNPIVEHF